MNVRTTIQCLAGVAIAIGAAAISGCNVTKSSAITDGISSPTPQVNNARPVDVSPTPLPASEFKTSLEMHGIKFLVESPNSLAGNTIRVTPSGLEVSNDPFTSPVNGEVIDAQVGDLNVDRSPEVYVFVRERGSLGRVNVVGYGTNARKSMSEFMLPEPDLGAKAYQGYNGKDEFEVVENTLSRRFPLFDGKGVPTKKTRVVQYKIKPGEATWSFYLVRFDDF